MLSGYLLLKKTEPLGNFLKKRLSKIVIPLVGWTIFYSVLIWKLPMTIYVSQTFTPSLDSALRLLFSPVIYHMWFLYAILGIYLVIPMLRLVVQNAARPLLYYLIALWFFASSILFTITTFTTYYNVIDLRMISGYGGFFIAGAVLGEIEISKKQLVGLSFLAALMIFIGSYGTYLSTKDTGLYSSFFLEYLSPNVIILSFSSFLILKKVGQSIGKINKPAIHKGFKIVGAASFGIYLVHVFVLDMFAFSPLGSSLSVLERNPIFSIPLTTIIVFASSLVIVLILKKIPVLKRLVP